MSQSRVLTVALIAVLALLLSACGGGADEGSGDHAAGGDHAADERVHDPVDGAPDVTITAVDIDFQPDRLELTAGEPTNVTVVNDGKTVHDFTLEEADVHVNVEPGEETTTSVVVDEPGDYTAICTVPGHEAAGMVVDVAVSEDNGP